jgi:hypothetical protein
MLGPVEIVASQFEPTAVALLVPLNRQDHGHVGFNYKVGDSEADEYTIDNTPFQPSESGRAVLELGPHHFVIVGAVAHQAAYLHLWWHPDGRFPDGVRSLLFTGEAIPELKAVPGVVRVYPYRKANGDDHYLLTSFDKDGVVIVEMDRTMSTVVRKQRLNMPHSVKPGKIWDAIAVPRPDGSVLAMSYSVKPIIEETASVQLDPTWSRSEWQDVSTSYDLYQVLDAIPMPDGRIALTGRSGVSIQVDENGVLRAGELEYWVKLCESTGTTVDIQRWPVSGSFALFYRRPALSLNLASQELVAAFQPERKGLSLYVFSARGVLLDTYSLETPELENPHLTALTSLPTQRGFLAAKRGSLRYTVPLPTSEFGLAMGIQRSTTDTRPANMLLSITPSGTVRRSHEIDRSGFAQPP